MSKHLITVIFAVSLVAAISSLGLASMEWRSTNITNMPVSLTYVDPQSGKKVFRNLSGLLSNFIIVDRDSENHHAISLHTQGRAGSNLVIDANAVGSGVSSGAKTSVVACQQTSLDSNVIKLDDGLSLKPDAVLMKVDYTRDAANVATFTIKMTAAGVLDYFGQQIPGQVAVSATAAGVPPQPTPTNISIGRDFAFGNLTGVNPTATNHIFAFDFGDSATLDLALGGVPGNLPATVVSGPFNGAIPDKTNLQTGKATYIPKTGFSGVDTFTYFLHDPISTRKSEERSVEVTVRDRPVAHDVRISRVAFRNATTAVFVNFTAFVEHLPKINHNIHFGDITGVEHGRLDHKDHILGRVAYRPPSDFSGDDHFTYSIDDKLGYHQEAVVTVSVVPFALDDDFDVRAFTANPVTFPVLVDDRGVDALNTTLQIVSVVKLSNTTSNPVISDDKRSILYTPGNSPVGSDDFFVYTVTDTSRPLNNRPLSSATVRVHITP